MNFDQTSKTLLIVASFILFIIAITFGGNPTYLLPKIYHTEPVTDINTIAIYRSVMGLIWGCCIFWLYSAFTGRFRMAALYQLMFSMFGLSSMRIVSAFIDGFPSTILIVFLVMELATGFTVLRVIRKNDKAQNKLEV